MKLLIFYKYNPITKFIKLHHTSINAIKAIINNDNFNFWFHSFKALIFLFEHHNTKHQKISTIIRLQIKLIRRAFNRDNFSMYFIIIASNIKTKISHQITQNSSSHINNGNTYQSIGKVIQEHNTHVNIIFFVVIFSFIKVLHINHKSKVSERILLSYIIYTFPRHTFSHNKIHV